MIAYGQNASLHDLGYRTLCVYTGLFGNLVQPRLMARPSPDVYVQHRGYIDLDDEHPMFLYTDKMSPQEVDVLFGCIHSDSNKDKSLYLSKDILANGCFFWTGKWDMWMKDMFSNLTKKILQGSAKFCTPGMWNEYFRCHHKYW